MEHKLYIASGSPTPLKKRKVLGAPMVLSHMILHFGEAKDQETVWRSPMIKCQRSI